MDYRFIIKSTDWRRQRQHALNRHQRSRAGLKGIDLLKHPHLSDVIPVRRCVWSTGSLMVFDP